jgi:hypothetical protein
MFKAIINSIKSLFSHKESPVLATPVIVNDDKNEQTKSSKKYKKRQPQSMSNVILIIFESQPNYKFTFDELWDNLNQNPNNIITRRQLSNSLSYLVKAEKIKRIIFNKKFHLYCLCVENIYVPVFTNKNRNQIFLIIQKFVSDLYTNKFSYEELQSKYIPPKRLMPLNKLLLKYKHLLPNLNLDINIIEIISPYILYQYDCFYFYFNISKKFPNIERSKILFSLKINNLTQAHDLVNKLITVYNKLDSSDPNITLPYIKKRFRQIINRHYKLHLQSEVGTGLS